MESLISVVVLTYNSSEFVLETLESVKDQIYKYIEILISDDGSTDETTEICSRWLVSNRARFVRAELLKSRKNTGIPANCNRGVKASSGEWIKLIAGDDLLDKKLLVAQMDYIKKNSNISVNMLWTNVGVFYNNNKERIISVPQGISDLKINSKDITCQQQFQILLRQNPVYTGGFLIKNDVFSKAGLFDESYPSFEDRPFLLSALLNGFKLHYLDIVGAYYRKHEASVQLINPDLLLNSFKIDTYRYEITMLKYYSNIIERSFRYLNAKYNLFYIRSISNKKNIINKFFLYGPSIIMRFVIKLFTPDFK